MGKPQTVFCPNCQTPTFAEDARQACLLALDCGVVFMERTCPLCSCLFRFEADADGVVFHTEAVSPSLILVEAREAPERVPAL